MCCASGSDAISVRDRHGEKGQWSSAKNRDDGRFLRCTPQNIMRAANRGTRTAKLWQRDREVERAGRSAYAKHGHEGAQRNMMQAHRHDPEIIERTASASTAISDPSGGGRAIHNCWRDVCAAGLAGKSSRCTPPASVAPTANSLRTPRTRMRKPAHRHRRGEHQEHPREHTRNHATQVPEAVDSLGHPCGRVLQFVAGIRAGQHSIMSVEEEQGSRQCEIL